MDEQIGFSEVLPLITFASCPYYSLVLGSAISSCSFLAIFALASAASLSSVEVPCQGCGYGLTTILTWPL